VSSTRKARRTVAVYRSDAPVSVHREPDVIDAAPVLRDFHLDLTELFSVLGPM
jgi:hypothetical protein